MKKSSFLFFLILILYNISFSANQLDSLRILLKKNLPDSVRFEVYNQIFPKIVKQNIDSALWCLTQQKQILSKANLDKKTTNEFKLDIYNNSGTFYNRKGMQDTSIFYYQKVIDIATMDEKKREIAIAQNNIANIYYLQGNYQAALEYHLKALKIRKQIADTNGMAMSYGNIGLIHSSLKEYGKCIDYYEKSKRFFELQNNQSAISWVYRAIGEVYLDTKQYDKAIRNLNKSLRICSKIGDFSGIKYSMLNLGIVYLGKYEKTKNTAYLDSAEFSCDKVHELQQKSFIKRIEINYLNLISQIFIFRKKYLKAIDLLNESEKLLEDITLQSELKDVYRFKSKAYESLGDYKSALANFKKFKQITDTLFSIEKDKKIGRKEAQFEYNEKLKIAKLKSENKIKLAKVAKDKIKLWLIIIVLFAIFGIIIFIYILRKLTKEKRLLNQKKEQILLKYNNIEEAYNEALTNLERLKTHTGNIKKPTKLLPAWINSLSKRETEVLSCLAVGMSDKEIEKKLFISVTTVRTHCRRIYSKLLVKNRMEAVNLAKEYELI